MIDAMLVSILSELRHTRDNTIEAGHDRNDNYIKQAEYIDH